MLVRGKQVIILLNTVVHIYVALYLGGYSRMIIEAIAMIPVPFFSSADSLSGKSDPNSYTAAESLLQAAESGPLHPLPVFGLSCPIGKLELDLWAASSGLRRMEGTDGRMDIRNRK